ncbi:VOC family protein [Virgisporangium ochraceum]|uniref:Extradiol dioxygenase n=1 Tax=Virgisporangium ochraceum TaxID=65505 RepID=A0A8J3ZX32_9ACTN|nr:VOC family protein [Virgisporangium ochraceum]GIJ68991.1 extradiol dioxygenase [Virgisporangium ochraceum]
MFQEMFPILSTPDLPRALAFYRDLLGATVSYRFPPTGEPAYVGLDLGRSQLGIGAESDPPGTADASHHRFSLWIYCDDCDAAVSKLRAAGVPVVEEPADQPWGERMATVTDPDGTKVIIATRQ